MAFLGAPSHTYTNLQAYFLPFAHVYLHAKNQSHMVIRSRYIDD